MGIALEVAELAAAIAYLARRQPRHGDFDDDEVDEGGRGGGIRGDDGILDAKAPGVGSNGSDGPPSWINYTLAATFAVQALMIGTVLSTGPLFLYTVHGIPVGSAGYLFAAAETAGACVLFATLRPPEPKGNGQGSIVPVCFPLFFIDLLI
jgi:hypothetical protein